MPKSPHIEKHGHTILVGGDAVYVDRRCAVTWPGPESAGYYCIFGLLDEPTAYGEKPLVLLGEGSDPARDKFYDMVTGACHRWHAQWVFADTGNKLALLCLSFSNRLKSRNHGDIQLIDAGEYSSFDAARPIIDAMSRKKLLRITPKGIMWNEIAAITPADMHITDRRLPEHMFPAVNALNHIVTGYEVYPWRKPKKRTAPAPKDGYG